MDAQTQALAQALQQVMLQGGAQYSAGIAGSPPYANTVNGPGGLFSTPGIRTPVFSAYTLPTESLLNSVPVMDSDIAEQLVQLITGIGTPNGTAPTGVCDDPQTAGFEYGCRQVYPYGLLSYSSEVINVATLTLQARGAIPNLPVVGGVNPMFPTAPTVGNGAQGLTQNNVTAQLFMIRAQFLRTLGAWAYSGNPASSLGPGQVPFKGLDLQIKTGYVDVDSGTACPALDSCVKVLNSADPATIFTAITDCWNVARIRAEQSGLNPVRWALAMHPSLFDHITEFWPCTYQTTTCLTSFDDANVRTINANDITAERDRLRTGKYLLFRGERIPVITDGNIAITGTTTLESSVYLVPMTVLGGIPVTFLEAMNFDRAVGIIAPFVASNTYSTTDGGRFLTVRKPVNNLCAQMSAYIMPRLMLLTPHLAARITDIQWTPSTVLPGWVPGQAGYVNGGIQSI